MIQDGMPKMLLSLAAKNVIKFVLPLLLQNFLEDSSFILILLLRFGKNKYLKTISVF
jgi:hypothetical protein